MYIPANFFRVSVLLAATTALALVQLPLLAQCSQLPQNTSYPANTRPVLKLPSYGGPSGTAFDDVRLVKNVLKIKSFGIGSLYQVDYIQVNYTLTNGSVFKAPEHGDGIFVPDVISLSPDEYVKKLEGLTNGEYVNQLYVTTYAPKTESRMVYGPYGSPKLNATQKFTFEGNIVGFYGTVGKEILSSLGAYAILPAKRSDIFSKANGKNFTDDPDASFPPVVAINKLYIGHALRVVSIQAEYQLFGGGTRKGPRNGGSGGITTVIDLTHERIVGVRGKIITGSVRKLGQLSFVTKDGSNRTKSYGPFGVRGSENFSLEGNVIGFSGAVYRNVIETLEFFYWI